MRLAASIACSSEENVATGATGPKISSSSSRASRGHVGEHGRRVEVAALADALAAEQHAARRAAGVVDQLGDLVALVVVDQRADVGVGLGAAADLQRAHALGHPPCELVGERLVHVEAVGRRARLADVAHLREHRALDRSVEVGVLEHEERRVAAELHRDAQDLLGGLFDQLAPDLRRAGERQLARARVLQQRFDHRRPSASR